MVEKLTVITVKHSQRKGRLCTLLEGSANACVLAGEIPLKKIEEWIEGGYVNDLHRREEEKMLKK